MAQLGLETAVVDSAVLARTVQRFRECGIVLPTFAQLADPSVIPAGIRDRLAAVDPDSPDPLNLFRIHWYNAADRRGTVAVPGHVVLPRSLTGVDAPIVVVFGERFPMIAAHKVLAAYSCLAPRVITGQFDPTRHKAIWPSTGNYCRGGVAVSRIMQSRGVAILPEMMSRERFAWLEDWVLSPEDIVKTPGSESNVKEIYDKCAEIDASPENVVFNQFCEFGNVLGHWAVTGRALGHVYEHLRGGRPDLDLFAYVSATGSAGTLAAGDRLKEDHGARIAAVEAVECPTLLRNGFGEHNIQGIGDKHVPYVHNVYNTDYVVAVSDAATDSLFQVFNHPDGLAYLADRHGVPAATLRALASFGLSSVCNVLAAIKLAKYNNLDSSQAIITVATDGAAMYGTEQAKFVANRFGGRFDREAAAEAFGRYMLGIGTDDMLEATLEDRHRMFNLGYFTWVEQQGVELQDFVARSKPTFWRGLRDLLPAWDGLIDSFNAAAGVE